MAFFVQQLRRTSFANLPFERARSSFFPLLRSPTVHELKMKVFSTSNYGNNKAHLTSKTGKEKELDQRSRSTAADSNNRIIHVGNLLKGQDYTTEDSVYKYFSQFGKIELLQFFRHKFTKLPRGFVFITFQDAESAQKVLAEAGSHVIDGQKVTVEVPLRKVKPAELQKRDMTVLVNNIQKNTSKQGIEKHFSQFGKVDRVILAQKDPRDENLSSYYVIFSSLSGAKKALEQPSQKICEQNVDSQVTEFPITSLQSRNFSNKTKCVSVTLVPDHLTVEDLRDYFQRFGDVESVDFVVNGGIASYNPTGNSNVAFVRFPNYAIVNEIVKNENHIINGSKVKVSKYRDMADLVSEQMRELKLSVEGLPLSTQPWAVQDYFERFFGVVPNGVFLNQHRLLIDKKLVCVVRFSNTREVEKVLKEQKGIFQGQPVFFRRLIWKKPQQQ